MPSPAGYPTKQKVGGGPDAAQPIRAADRAAAESNEAAGQLGSSRKSKPDIYSVAVDLGQVREQPARVCRGGLLAATKRGDLEDALKYIQASSVMRHLECDEEGRNAAHYAAMRPDGVRLLTELDKMTGSSCLLQEDLRCATPLHYAAANFPLSQIDGIWQGLARDLRKIQLNDDFGNTVAHYAAKNCQHREVLDKILKIAGPGCLLWRNHCQQTVLHIAVLHLSTETVRNLLETAKLMLENPKINSYERAKRFDNCDLGAMSDRKGDTLAHFAARNQCLRTVGSEKRNVDVFEEVVSDSYFGRKCLDWKNSRGQSVFQTVIQHQPDSSAEKMTELASIDVDHRDEDGNTVLHYAGLYRKPSTFKAILSRIKQFDENRIESILKDANRNGQTPLHFAAQDQTIMDFLKQSLSFGERLAYTSQADRFGRNMLFYCCLGWNFKLLLKAPYKDALVRDIHENTLLHALLLGSSNAHGQDLKEFSEAAGRLITDSHVDPKAENILGQNWLQSCLLDEATFEKLLLSDSKNLKQWLKSNAFNSSGFHLLHFYASRYSLERIMKPLKRLLDFKGRGRRLLRQQVLSGPRKGATSLHFACQSGHTRNVTYLLRKGLRLTDLDQSGLTCIDYAIEFGESENLMEALRMPELDELRLTDPVRRSLKLPARSSAHQLLSATLGAQKLCVASNALMPAIANKPSISLSALFKAWDQDSPRTFRAALKLDLLHSDTEADLIQHLERNCTIKYNRFESFVTDVQGVKRSSELEIIDMALINDKLDLLPDLVITRQFDLIPACIRLLVQLQHETVGAYCRDEKRTKLKEKIADIVVQFINFLFENANNEERQLLFRYIRGHIWDDEPQQSGPLFPIAYTSSQTGENTYCGKRSPSCVAVIDLIEEADSEKLYSTDCIHALTEDEWQNFTCSQSRGERPVCSSHFGGILKASFYAHLAIHLLFLFYFSWYVTDFVRTFRSWTIDAVLTAFASLFLIIEVIDIVAAFLPRNFCGRRTSSKAGRRLNRCPAYCRDFSNLINWCALTLLWLGVIWKWCIYSRPTDVTAYACQSILAAALLMWGLRLISFLNFFGTIGPVITTMKCVALQDLLPFCAIITVIFYSFGIFFFNLLFPVTTSVSSENSAQFYWWQVMMQIFTLPLDLLFTNFERATFDTPRSSLDQSIGSVANSIGSSWYRRLMIFVFLGLVNIVLMYLLIARFTHRVSMMQDRAVGLWRRAYFELLREHQRRASFFACGCSRTKVDCETENWWTDERKYPAQYLKYLGFQARQLRRFRPQLAELAGPHEHKDGLAAKNCPTSFLDPTFWSELQQQNNINQQQQPQQQKQQQQQQLRQQKQKQQQQQ